MRGVTALRKSIARFIGTFALVVFEFFLTGPARAQTADIILVNGKILTLDGRSSVQQALAAVAPHSQFEETPRRGKP